MFRTLRPRSVYDIVAGAALFVALGGSAYAVTNLPKNSVGTQQLTKNAVTAPKLANGAVTTPKLANGAVTGAKVGKHTVTGVNIKPGTLGTVPDASHLGGAPASAYAKAPGEPFHETGLNPACDNAGNYSWFNYDSVNNSTFAYLRDPFGIVHLKGTVACPDAPKPGIQITGLPPGYTPAKIENFAAPGAGGITSIAIFPDGRVVWVGGNSPGPTGYLDLDGVSFRCEPSGSDGCP